MRPSPARSWLWPVLMALGVAAVYWPPSFPTGTSLAAVDFHVLHAHRMAFAREALFGAHPYLPAWYPREATGTPFWSNIQNFPFLPTRLLLLALDPLSPTTFAVGASVAAVLAALFTYLLARRLGLAEVPAAIAGWTFACCGYFAGRIPPGHLPLLEVFAALPMMLWMVESLAQDGRTRRLLVLAAGSFLLLLGGHPQLPLYALIAAALYVPLRLGVRRGLWAWAALGLGGGLASFVWVPMLSLIGRSTRVLALAHPDHDVSLPWARLASFFWPWAQGAAEPIASAASLPRTTLPSQVYWDTTLYTGLAPWLALAVLAALALRRRLAWPLKKAHLFVLSLGVAGLALALPWTRALTEHLPGTLVSSPARLLYLSELALAMVLGITLDQLWRLPSPWVSRLLPVALALHAIDLSHQSRRFVTVAPVVTQRAEEVQSFARRVGSQRVGIDTHLPIPISRAADDVGFFDSTVLARPYRTIIDWAGKSPDLNVQVLSGAELPRHVLRATGVRWIMSFEEDLRGLRRLTKEPFAVYEVDGTLPRAAFYPLSRTRWLPADVLHAVLRSEGPALLGWLLLPGLADPPTEAPLEPIGAVDYERKSADQIACRVDAPSEGFVQVTEAFDEGWSATVDGHPEPTVPAMDAWLAVRVPPGRHELILTYRTVGASLGLALSAACALALGALCAAYRRSRGPTAGVA